MPTEQEPGDFGINIQPSMPRVPERGDRSVIQLNSGCLAPVAGMLLIAVTSSGLGAFLMDKYNSSADNDNTNVPPIATVTPLTVRVSDMHPTDRQEFYSAKYYVEKDAVYEHKAKVPFTDREVTVRTSSIEIAATARCTAGIDHKKKEPIYRIDGEKVDAEVNTTEIFGCYEQVVRFSDEKRLLWFSFPEEERNRILAEIHGELMLEAQNDGLADKAAEHAKIRLEWQLYQLKFRDVRVRLIGNLPPEDQVQVRPSPSPSPARR